jgi:hypothetical protein
MILLFTVFGNAWRSEPMMAILVSSAKRIGLDVSKMVFKRSLICNRKTKDQVWSLMEQYH